MDQREHLKENKQYFELNKIENETYQNFWDAAKVVQKMKFESLNAHIRNEEISKINNLHFYPRN